MPHIELENDLPGIVGLIRYAPQTGRPLAELTEALLRGPSPLSRGERELVAAFVSTLDQCAFCVNTHAAFAKAQVEGGADVVEAVRRDYEHAPITPKMKALLAVAERVQKGGRAVKPTDVAAARAAGATDREIHDVVLIAATICMTSRYVDGLAATTPTDPRAYEAMAQLVTGVGYAGG
jgi:uncharacterized peroxidase-related enzyme